MKLAQKLAALAVAALALALASAASAGATGSIKPHKLVVPGDGFSRPAIDGTDVYWLSQQKLRKGKSFRYDVLLHRTSLVDGAHARLMRFHDYDGFYIEGVLAGGGQVVVNLESDEYNRSKFSKVLRMGRDGSNPELLGSGAKPGWKGTSVVENSRAVSNDCGTYVHAQSVTSTGSVVLMRTVADRESAACGNKVPMDHLRVDEVSLIGANREIYSEDIPLEESEATGSGSGTGSGLGGWAGDFPVPYTDLWGTKITVQGDRAAYVKVTGGPAYVRDLNTGALSGPFGTGLLGGAQNSPSLDPNGRVALSAVQLRSKYVAGDREPPRDRLAVRTGVFSTPLSPTPFIHLGKMRTLQFCGSRLIGGTKSALVELDPITFSVKRRITNYPKHSRAWGISDYCTDSYLYTLGLGPDKVSVAGYPLD